MQASFPIAPRVSCLHPIDQNYAMWPSDTKVLCSCKICKSYHLYNQRRELGLVLGHPASNVCCRLFFLCLCNTEPGSGSHPYKWIDLIHRGMQSINHACINTLRNVYMYNQVRWIKVSTWHLFFKKNKAKVFYFWEKWNALLFFTESMHIPGFCGHHFESLQTSNADCPHVTARD